jgi:uncharacterized protein YvpB
MEEQLAFGQTDQELAEISRQVDATYEQTQPPRRKIAARLGLGVVTATTVAGIFASGCFPKETEATQSPTAETVEASPTIVEGLRTMQPTEVFTPTPEPIEEPTETSNPTQTPEPTLEPQPTPTVEAVQLGQPELFGAGGYDEEFAQRVESGEFSEQEELLNDWVKGPWAELSVFHPETERVNFKYFRDLKTGEIVVAIESEDYPDQALYYPLNLEASQELGRQVFDKMPESPDPEPGSDKTPSFLTLAGYSEGSDIPEDATLAIEDGNWQMVNPQGQKVGEINLETGQWQLVEQPPEQPPEEPAAEPTVQATVEPTVEYDGQKTEDLKSQVAVPSPTSVPIEVVKNAETGGIDRVILDIPLDAQNLSLSCESGAAAMVVAYYGVSVPEGFDSLEDYFIKTIPMDCNPHEGYRGLISGALSTSCNVEAGLGYGTYAEPVAAALQRLGVPAEVHYGVDYNWVAEQVKSGRPVVVWMSGRDVQPEYETDPETGQEYVLYLGEHLWVISGVEEVNGRYKFRVNDPWKGRQYWVWGFPSWDVFGNMSIVAGN